MRTETFYYDNSGYYGYVLFSGTNAELHGLLNALGRGDKEHGFGWHRWGRSFRPADNGTVYDYYIRLRSKTGTKPAPGVVEAFLKEALPPRETLTGESERELAQDDAPEATVAAAPASDDPPPWANDFLSRVEVMHLKTVDSITQKMSEELMQLHSAIGHTCRRQPEINRLQANLEQTREELVAKEAELETKESEIETLRNAPRAASYDKQMQEDRNKANRAAEKARNERDQLKKDKNNQIIELKNQLKEAVKDGENWKDLYEKVNQQATEIKRQRDEEREPPPSAERTGGKLRMRDFEDIVKGAFPNLRLMQDSLETVYYGLQNYRALMHILARIVYEESYNGRNSMKNARKWREDRFDKEWRIYFCKESGLLGDKVLALIGDKNSQSNDTDWLRANPPESCL